MVSSYPIAIVDIKNKKLNFAKKLGASHLLNFNSKNFDEQIKKIFGSGGPEIVIDTVGNSNIISKSYSLVAKKGKVILVGQPKIKKSIILKNASSNFFGKKFLIVRVEEQILMWIYQDTYDLSNLNYMILIKLLLT